MSSPDVSKLEQISNELRLDIIKMLELAGSGHPGGSLSAIDLIASLFFSEMKNDPKDPLNEDRDRFVLSKGHGVPALYAVLAKRGFIPKDSLWTLRKINSKLQGHPDRVILPILEASTGSLGQGISIAQGLALGLRHQKRNSRVYCLVGDGETQEGQVWETAMSAPKFKLDNFVVILDNNHGQIDGTVEEVMDIRPIEEKWKSFGWYTQSIDGHDFSQILKALENARKHKGQPAFIHADTIKGKGVSFMERVIDWHGKAPSAEESKKAQGELQSKLTKGSP